MERPSLGAGLLCRMRLGWSAVQQSLADAAAAAARALPRVEGAAAPLAFGAVVVAATAVARRRSFPADTFPARVVSVERVGDDAVRIILHVGRCRGGDFRFLPGQWVDFFATPSLVGGYSLCSPPDALPRVTLLVKLNDHPCAQWCHWQLRRGDFVRIRAGGSALLPLGRLFPAGPAREGSAPTLILAAAGIGVTPALGVIEALLSDAEGSDYSLPADARLVVFYSCRRASDFVAHPRLLELARADAGRRLRLHLHRTAFTNPGQLSVTHADVASGLVRQHRRRVGPADVQGAVPANDPGATWALLCGPADFMSDLEAALQEAGVPQSHIVSERWW